MATKNFKKDNPALSFITATEKEGINIAPEAPANEMTRSPKAPKGYKLNPEYIETKSKRVQLLLQPSIVDAIKSLAKREGLSMNEAVNEAIKEYLHKH